MKKLLFSAVALVVTASFVFGQSNIADLSQDGSANSATITQTGATHEAYIDQFGTNHAEISQYNGSGNYAEIDQGASGSTISDPGLPSYNGDWIGGAYIEQKGSDNVATTAVHRSGSGASIFQEGDWNDAYQDLGSSQHKTTDWSRLGLDIDQVGNDNLANQKTVASFGVFGIQGMAIVQEGDQNVANQYSKGGAYATMEVFQYGNRNNNPAVSGNSFDLSALGFDPLALPWADKPAGEFTQYQNAYKGTAHISVTGNGNNTAQYQEYTVWSAGGDNEALIDILGNQNDVAQGQLGEYNHSAVSILPGFGNVVGTSQMGDYNQADVSISGGQYNVAGIQQTGNSHDADISIVGQNNTANIIQQ